MLMPYHGLDQMLEVVAVVAWDDLIHPGTPGLVHIKYRLGDNHNFANLEVWTSETRGRWLLVCEYSGVLSAAGSANLVFSNGYRSEVLTHFLTFVIEHQHMFASGPKVNRDSLVQVQPPDEGEKLSALKFLNKAQTILSHQAPAFTTAD